MSQKDIKDLERGKFNLNGELIVDFSPLLSIAIQGPQGEQGEQGEVGPQGIQGVPGTAGTVDHIATSLNTTTPNNVIPAVSFAPSNAATNVDFVLMSKGAGAIQAQIADGTTTGGNKRGANAVDFQVSRVAAAQVASGASSFAYGIGNLVSGAQAIGGGAYCTSSGAQSVALGYNCWSPGNSAISMGYGSTASATAAIALGFNCTSDAIGSIATGASASVFGVYGRRVHSAFIMASAGDNQKSTFSLCKATTDATPIKMTADNGTASATNQVVLPNNGCFAFNGMIVVKQSASLVSSSWKIEGHIVRGANAGTTSLVASTITAISNASAITIPALSADTTNGALSITVTGIAATTLKWSARIETTEIISA